MAFSDIDSAAVLTALRAREAASRANGNESSEEVINSMCPKWPAAISNRAKSELLDGAVGDFKTQMKRLMSANIGYEKASLRVKVRYLQLKTG